jgi:uncharacterized protein (DUF58 family)
MAAPGESIGGASLRQRAEQVAALLPPLLVAAERIAVTVEQGVHGRRRVGTGDAFWQYRRYQPGDAANLIDWRQSAKRQGYFIRQNEWEAAESVWLWRDGSPSMRWRSKLAEAEKKERAELVLLALAALLVRGGERIGLLGEDRLPSTGRATLDRLTEAMLRPVAAGASLPPTVELPRHAQLVLIGDFLSPLPEIEATVRRFAGRGIKGHLLQIVDPAEETLPFEGRTRFHGLEGESALTVSRVETIKSDWERRLRLRHDSLKEIAQRAGWTFSTHHTDRPPQTALLALHAALSGALLH